MSIYHEAQRGKGGDRWLEKEILNIGDYLPGGEERMVHIGIWYLKDRKTSGTARRNSSWESPCPSRIKVFGARMESTPDWQNNYFPPDKQYSERSIRKTNANVGDLEVASERLGHA